jgi:hypothetical protein
MDKYESTINFESNLIFWGIPGLIVLVSFFFMRKGWFNKIVWFCLLMLLAIGNFLSWSHKEKLLSQNPHNYGLGENIDFTVFTNSEAVGLFIFSLCWYFISKSRKSKK